MFPGVTAEISICVDTVLTTESRLTGDVVFHVFSSKREEPHAK
jgi:hypothetical protein